MTRARVRRGGSRRTRAVVVAVVSAAIVVAALFWTSRTPVEVAPGLFPDPIDPYGPVTRGEVVFRWAIPADLAPVRVEVLDATASGALIWKSEPGRKGTVRPPAGIAASWPMTDLLWRPVGVPASGPERPGPLAAFTLLP